MGNFVSAYCCTGERIFDLHPPHGKLLIAAGARLGGYDGKFTFGQIGKPYGDVPVFALRFVPALAGVLIAPLFLLLLVELGASFPDRGARRPDGRARQRAGARNPNHRVGRPAGRVHPGVARVLPEGGTAPMGRQALAGGIRRVRRPGRRLQTHRALRARRDRRVPAVWLRCRPRTLGTARCGTA